MHSHHRLFLSIVGCLLLMLLAACGYRTTPTTASRTPTTGVTPSRCGTWHLIQSINPASDSNYFLAVAATSVRDVWAVGSTGIPAQQGLTGLTEHWDGSAWRVVDTPLPPQSSAYELTAVTAISTNDAWAVGNVDLPPPGGTQTQTLIEHWDGSQWSIITHPHPSAEFAQFRGVRALSENDIWAVGSYIKMGSGSPVTLIEHWDGSHWSMIPSPNPGANGNVLTSLAALSANDLWAAGYSDQQPLVEHWDGSAWRVVFSPSHHGRGYLNSVSAAAVNDVWAVGDSTKMYGGNSQTLIEHWDGSHWSMVSNPSPASNWNTLWGVVTLSAHNVWAVGDSHSPGTGMDTALIEHWDGVQWRAISSPNPTPLSNMSLIAVTNVPGTSEIWAVGNQFSSGHRTFSEFYC